MPDRLGQLTALSMLGGAGYGGYIKAPMGWVGQSVFYGLVSLGGARITSKNPENVYVQLIFSSGYIYTTAQEMVVRNTPKYNRLFAPLIALSALNVAKCLYVLWNKEEPVRKI